MRSISKSSAGSILRSGAVQAFTALRKFITITVQRFLRRKKIKACGERKPLSDLTVAVEQALKWLTGAKQLKLQIRIILFRCDSPTAAATLWPQRCMKTAASTLSGDPVGY